MLEFYKQKLQLLKDGPTVYSMEKLSCSTDVVEFINKIEKYDLSPTKS